MAKPLRKDDGSGALTPAQRHLANIDPSYVEHLSINENIGDERRLKKRLEYYAPDEYNNLHLEKKPLHLSEKFCAHAEANLWENRRQNPNYRFSWNTSIFDFLKAVYEPWLGHGMTRAHLKHVDPKAWIALRDKLKKEPMPSWLNLPKQCDANLPEPGTFEHEARQKARRQNRERMRLIRSLS